MVRVATADWRRLDRPGTDRCALFAEEARWRLTGEACFGTGAGESRLTYEVFCDGGWRTRIASIAGVSAGHPVALRIEQGGGQWHENGAPQPQVEGLIDIDLFFTPATNTLPIRRMAFVPGRVQETTAAWLTPEFRLAPLRQSYRAVEDGVFDYASPDHDFRARLTVHRTGFVTGYPGLWAGEVRDG